ncbi:hypothetical protein HF680_07145 [Brevundimonas sp. WCHBH090558]|uniref:hypothetical protein n=1 Tax=Brevundimonas huaxiensis TaxID=2725493 RepID=UPI001629B890|nr:hypothetical protein [Brevundimonas huaxiensis]MBC1182426.1 hypothetical protein [Brevundimonas huaxiensis]
MSDARQSSQERLRELAKAIDGLERESALTPVSDKPKKLPEPELGPKTKFTVKILTWFFRVYWVVWITVTLTVDPPLQLEKWLYVPFSALVCWLIFQFHKAVIVAAAKKISSSRRS